MDQENPKSGMDSETEMNEQDDGERDWSNIPMNCLVDIFQKLPIYDLTLAIPFVCKSWYEASLDPYSWRILDFSNIDPSQNSAFGEKFKHEYRLEEYKFKLFLRFVMHRSRKLAVLLIPTPYISINDMAYILEECPLLDIYNPPLSSDNPGLMRNFLLATHSIMLQRATDLRSV